MDTPTLILFAATVLPLICTPGPDLLFVAAQAMTGGHRGALRANAGILAGYGVHAGFAAVGVAAMIAASPLLFGVLRWAGIGYLVWLAAQMARSACQPAGPVERAPARPASLARGFLTSFLNPKGLLVYVAILPNFLHADAEGSAWQAMALSSVFIALCGLVYAIAGAAIAVLGRRGAANGRLRQGVELLAAGMLAVAAMHLALRA